MANSYETSPPPPAAIATESRFGDGRVDVHHHDDRGGATGLTAGMHKRVSWGAIFAGAAIGVATLLLLTLLGIGIGMATIDPVAGGSGTPGLGALSGGSGIWLVVSQIIALLLGGYVAARLAGVPFKQGSIMHGIAVWAVATLAMFWLATTAVGAIAGGAASLLGTAGSGVAAAAEAAVPDDLSLDSLANLDQADLPAPIRNALERRGLTVGEIKREAQAMAGSVVSGQERDRATDIARDTASDVLNSPGDAGRDISAAVDKLFGGSDAVLSDEDRQQAEAELAERLGISEAEAAETFERWQRQAQEAQAAVEQNIEQAKAQAAEAAEAAASAVSGTAFLAFAASLLGLIAAAIGGLIGRPKDAFDHART